jgi:hypothetical protein
VLQADALSAPAPKPMQPAEARPAADTAQQKSVGVTGVANAIGTVKGGTEAAKAQAAERCVNLTEGGIHLSFHR